ncbi:MAG: hypothetical protein HYR63_23805 [Proteobacteria bacterium]|nr:hypothetical protein [Pseudomonadota bacterium]MBI3497655.1 hypothetical protein [Pseudomonadota bacterium]
MRASRVAVASAAVMLALASVPSAGEVQEVWHAPIQNWTLAAFRDKDSRRFHHCAVSVGFNSGITLGFAVDADLQWRMNLRNQAWTLPAGALQAGPPKISR